MYYTSVDNEWISSNNVSRIEEKWIFLNINEIQKNFAGLCREKVTFITNSI